MNNLESFSKWMSNHPKKEKVGNYERGAVLKCTSTLSAMLNNMGLLFEQLEDNSIFNCNDYSFFTEIEVKVRTHPDFPVLDGRESGAHDWYHNGLQLYGEFLLSKNGILQESRPDFLESMGKGTEGKITRFFTTKYERSEKNRKAAIEAHGLTCQCCGFNFETFYGIIGKDYIEVHHKVPLSSLKEEVQVDPKKDLACVCSNCHRMIHREKYKTLTVEQLRKKIKQQNS